MATDAEIDTFAGRCIAYAHDFDRASPLYAHLARAAATDRELLALFCESPPEQQRPTLPLAAVHHLLFRGAAHPFGAYVRSVGGSRAVDEQTFGSFRDFCFTFRDDLVTLLRTKNTQTNEVRRAAQLLPAVAIAARNQPIALVEIGPSGGLNLILDRYAYAYGDGLRAGAADALLVVDCEARGPLRPPLPDPLPAIALRIGIDEQPIDVHDDDATAWLAACIWPEQEDRRRLLRAAIEVARADPPEIVRGDALELIDEVCARVPDTLPLVVMDSMVMAYMPPDARTQLARRLEAVSRARDLTWVTAEPPLTIEPLADLPADVRARHDAVRRAMRGEGPFVEGFVLVGLARFSGGTVVDRRHLALGGHHGHWLEWIEPRSAA